MSSRIRNSLNAGIAALVVSVAAITLVPTDASAFSMGGHGLGNMGGGHTGSLGHMGSLGHVGGLGHLAGTRSLGNLGHATNISKMGRSISASKSAGVHAAKHTSHTSVANASDRISKTRSRNSDRAVGGGMYEKAGTGKTANGDRPVGGGMYEKAGTGKTANGDRPVGGGMYEKAGTGTTANGDRPVGGGMYEKAGTGKTANGDRPVGGGMYEKAGTGKTANGDRPVGGGMYEKAGTGKTANGDRPVGGGMYEKHGTGTTANGDRPVGGGMYEKHGTGTDAKDDRPVGDGKGNDGYLSVSDPEKDNGGFFSYLDVPEADVVPFNPAQVSVSYGSTPEVGIVRVDDLPQNINRVQNNCAELQAKVAYLANKLARQLRVLSALQGTQNVDYTATATGISTSFASPEDAQYAIDRIESDIADSQQLLARYQADLARCLAAGK